jgi:hypothetical protein
MTEKREEETGGFKKNNRYKIKNGRPYPNGSIDKQEKLLRRRKLW